MSEGASRHYELVVIFDTDFGDQVPEMVKNYCSSIESGGGVVTRNEDWGWRGFAYKIGNHNKGRYILINFSCDDVSLAEQLQDTLDNDDPVIRSLMVRTGKEVSEPSAVMIALEKEQAAKEQQAATASN